MNRFGRIKNEFGVSVLLRTFVLLVGLLGMSLLDYFAFSSIWGTLIAIVGLALGYLLRREIARGVEHYPRIINVGLFIYPLILFLGDKLGLGNSAKVAIITVTTVSIFDLQFWSLSDPSVVNAERRVQR